MAVRKIKPPCPYCGGKEFVRGAYARKQVYHPKKPLGAYYTVQVQICKNCGSIVREFITDPKYFPEF